MNDELRNSLDQVTRELNAARERIAELEVRLRDVEIAPLRALVEGTATVDDDLFFDTLVRYLTQALDCRYSFVSEFEKGRSLARTIAFCDGQEIRENFEFNIQGTPCEKVLSGSINHFADRVQEQFPQDSVLAELGIRSYLAIPMIDPRGDVLGHLAILDTEPFPESVSRLSVLQIFAARATAQLMIRRTESELEHQTKQAEAQERARQRAEAESIHLRQQIKEELDEGEIIGKSPALLAVLKHVDVVSPTDSTVLIQGETGTGKELFARAIHNRSERHAGPFIKLNCAAIPENLVESELFGHEKGAFTGAHAQRPGRFELADGGTLFLDEIGEMPMAAQARTLRVLQEREFDRVGGTKSISVDVRVVAATNRDLQQRAEEGEFRLDLFYRLNVFPIVVPPLRDRLEDIPDLVFRFVERLNARVGRRVETVPAAVVNQLSKYDWPGNIRELQNAIERAVILSPGSQLELPPGSLPDVRASAVPGSLSTLEDLEREHIRSVLEKTKGTIGGPAGAAEILGLNANTLRSRMKKLGVDRLS